MMSKKRNNLLIPLLVLVLMLVFAGCAADQTAYEKNNEDGYTVSVKFDANGGFFTTNTSVIVDSFNLEQLPVDQQGNAQIALIAPDDAARGNDAFTPSNSGCFLAGWYATRTETADGTGYVYADKWDFSGDILTVDSNRSYSSDEPVLTLYAAWVPMFAVEFYDLSSGTLVSNYTFDPTAVEALDIPAWNAQTGAIEMYRFPTVKGYTYAGAYYDAEGKEPVTGETLIHPGIVNYETGVAENGVLKLYVDYIEGEWYHIYNADQFVANASVAGCYEIYGDLDFADVIWPSNFVYGSFSGKINGNGHTFRNIEAAQTNSSKTNAGLFGSLAEGAQIKDLTFENVTLTIEAGTRLAGTSYGLFAGTIADTAVLDRVSVKNGVLAIDSACYFGTTDYTIGLVCGMGDGNVLTESDITCVATGDAPDTLHIIVDDGVVTVQFD